MPEYGMYEGAQTGNPLSQVKHFVPADQFFREYANMAFGSNKQFKIVSVTPDDELKQEYEKAFAKSTANAKITTASVQFEFNEGTEKRTGKVNGVAYLAGGIWGVDCSGYTTSVDQVPLAEKCITEIRKSFKTNPEWREKENQAFASRMETDRQNSDARMRQMTNAHNQRMNDMNANFNAHQSRMNNLQSSYDAQNQAWNNNQANQDNQHRRNVDLIRGEEQVRNGNQVGKVESGYNHYYINKSTGQYFGTNSQPQSPPENYEEWQIDH
jgi:hypothetical protein